MCCTVRWRRRVRLVKTAGFELATFEGPARVFDREGAAIDALNNGEIKSGDAVVIRYEGPKGGPGMREMLAFTAAIKGAGLGKDVLLLTGRQILRRHNRTVYRPRIARDHRRWGQFLWFAMET